MKLENKEAESKVVKVLVFPFRLIAMVFEAIGPFFRFLFEAFRVFVSLILFVIGAAFLFSIVLHDSLQVKKVSGKASMAMQQKTKMQDLGIGIGCVLVVQCG